MKQKPYANFSLGKKALPKLQVGDTVTFVVKGKIKNINASEYGNDFGLDLLSLKRQGEDKGLVGDIKAMKNRGK